MRGSDGRAGAANSPRAMVDATRCSPWDVRALVAHLCPNPEMFDMLDGARTDEPPVVSDGADLLRRFNEPGGIAHTAADDLAEQAVPTPTHLTPDAAVTRFKECARILRATAMSDEDRHQVSGRRHHDVGGGGRGGADGGDCAPARPGRRRGRCRAVARSAHRDTRSADRGARCEGSGRGARGPSGTRLSRCLRSAGTYCYIANAHHQEHDRDQRESSLRDGRARLVPATTASSTTAAANIDPGARENQRQADAVVFECRRARFRSTVTIARNRL